MRFIPIMFIGLAAALWWLDAEGLVSNLNTDNSHADLYVLALACLCYALLVMLPFVPGVELGYVIMMAFGLEGIVAVYFSTALSLFLSFLMGYFFRGHSTFTVFKNKLMNKNRCVYNKRAKIIVYMLKVFKRQPYLAVALLLNLPGNALIGGGGGIALMAGSSGQLQPYKYLFTVLLATSIIPFLLILGLSG
ncbi:MAG: hypothetical protein V7785_03845 [Bermanella sp.]